jgi:glucokinase
MLLAGDIGGTKTVLAMYSREKGVAGGSIFETRFESREYSSLEAIIVEFLRKTKAKPVAASFGVAGPVKGRRAQITNLPWAIDAEVIRESFQIDNVYLLNDLESIATAVPHLGRDDLITLNAGVPVEHGNIVVVAPGTGLGISFLVWTRDGYRAYASEAGHTSYAPETREEIALLKYLQRLYGHVSFERVCSGRFLPHIYDFLREQRSYSEPGWLQDALAAATDRTPVIVQAALEQKADICSATLGIFIHSLGTVCGNVAVTLLATGGIYLGGGIPPRILGRLQAPDFLSAITDKGRFSGFCADLPVHVIREPKVALSGAAWFGMEALGKGVDQAL